MHLARCRQETVLLAINDHDHISAACQAQGLASCAVNVYLPKDRVTSQHQGYGFVEFKSEEDADYVSPETHLSYSQHHASALSLRAFAWTCRPAASMAECSCQLW